MSARAFTLGLALIVLLLGPLADVALTTGSPGAELQRMGAGLGAPHVADGAEFARALLLTFAFGVLGTLLAAPVGLLLALLWARRTVRVISGSVRAIHELFWALLLMQVFGLSPWTGLLALALPFSAIFAKVFAEILAEQPDAALRALPPHTAPLVRWVCVRLPSAWPQMRTYLLTRAECGLRSSAVLGFIGLPTLGYHLDGALAYGAYDEAAAWLLGLIVLIAGFRWLLPAWSWPLWLLILPWTLPGDWSINTTALQRLLTEALWPAALNAGNPTALLQWISALLRDAILPGVINTLVLGALALAATALLTLVLWPLAARTVSGRLGAGLGHGVLLVLRSLPEYLLAYIFVLLWGPSMLPAIVALMLHNAAIIAFLMARASDQLTLRADAPRGVMRYGWEILPRLFAPYQAYLFYRWEIILRESAVVGLLGVYTLGFFVDSALAEMRLDHLPPLLLATVLLNLSADALSRRVRRLPPGPTQAGMAWS